MLINQLDIWLEEKSAVKVLSKYPLFNFLPVWLIFIPSYFRWYYKCCKFDWLFQKHSFLPIPNYQTDPPQPDSNHDSVNKLAICWWISSSDWELDLLAFIHCLATSHLNPVGQKFFWSSQEWGLHWKTSTNAKCWSLCNFFIDIYSARPPPPPHKIRQ